MKTWEKVTIRSLQDDCEITFFVKEGNVKLKCTYVSTREMKNLLKISKKLQDYYDTTLPHASTHIDPYDWLKDKLEAVILVFAPASVERRIIRVDYRSWIMALGNLISCHNRE